MSIYAVFRDIAAHILNITGIENIEIDDDVLVLIKKKHVFLRVFLVLVVLDLLLFVTTPLAIKLCLY